MTSALVGSLAVSPLLDLQGWAKAIAQEPLRRVLVTDDAELCKALDLQPYPFLLSVLGTPHRFNLFVGGWRVGKSLTSGVYLVKKSIRKGGHYWIVSKSYDLTHPEFDYATTFYQRLGETPVVSTPLQGPWTLKISRYGDPNWLLVQTRSAEDPQKLEAVNLDGAILAEAAQLGEDTTHRIMGRLLQKGGWLLASGSFEQSDVSTWFRQTYHLGYTDNEQDWQTFHAPSWENTAIFPKGREDSKIKTVEANVPLETFLEKVQAEPQVPVDLVFPEFKHDIHIAPVGRDSKYPVEIWVDFGYGAHYAVLAVQCIGDHCYLLDSFYETGFVTEDVVEWCKKRSWWPVSGGVMDVAGHQHQADRSQFELWHKLTGLWLRSKRIIPVHGIERLHTFLNDPGTSLPRITIDPKCKGLIMEFQNYKWRLVDGIKVGKEPENMYNHAMKALWYGLIDHFGYVEGVQRSPTVYKRSPYLRVVA